MYECAADRTGSGIQILVGAPNREIGRPVVQCKRHIANRVGEIEPNSASRSFGQPAEPGHIEYLSVVILHTGQQQQRSASAMLIKQCFEIIAVKFIVVAGFPFEHRISWIETVQANLRHHGVTV